MPALLVNGPIQAQAVSPTRQRGNFALKVGRGLLCIFRNVSLAALCYLSSGYQYLH